MRGIFIQSFFVGYIGYSQREIRQDAFTKPHRLLYLKKTEKEIKKKQTTNRSTL